MSVTKRTVQKRTVCIEQVKRGICERKGYRVARIQREAERIHSVAISSSSSIALKLRRAPIQFTSAVLSYNFEAACKGKSYSRIKTKTSQTTEAETETQFFVFCLPPTYASFNRRSFGFPVPEFPNTNTNTNTLYRVPFGFVVPTSLLQTTRDYKRLQETTRDYKRLQEGLV